MLMCVQRLQVRNVQSYLIQQVGAEIAKILYDLAIQEEPMRPSWLRFQQLQLQVHINRGLRHIVWIGLRRVALIYRFLHPHLVVQKIKEEAPIWGSQNTAQELHPLIKGEQRFEHLITGASDAYIKRRKADCRSCLWSKRLK